MQALAAEGPLFGPGRRCERETMSVMRSALLVASQSVWLREHATRYGFVRRAVSRFMPGEDVESAITAAVALRQQNIGTVFTQLGENVTDAAEAVRVAEHYVGVIQKVRAQGLGAELSIKLTQLGLDLGADLCYGNVQRIIEAEDPKKTVWIDMEASNYVDATLALYRRARAAYPNVGVCIQAYLFRTARDLAGLIPLGPAIRLVKGAYKEPPDVAYPQKRDVDENYFALSKELLTDAARRAGVRAAFATHDTRLIARITEYAAAQNLGKDALEFQMLYGIQRAEQLRLAAEGWRSIVLVAYGTYWFPWYMRRLAERPANLWFVLRNVFAS
jgi:proline dehydrogenase